MAEETKLQEMQRRLHVDKMESDEKKVMMDKLRKAGGKVVDLDTKKEAAAPKKGSVQRDIPRDPESRKPRGNFFGSPEMDSAPPHKPKPKAAHPKPASSAPHEAAAAVSFFTVLSHRMNCFLSWIFDFGARRFRERFVRFVCQEYQNSLLCLSNALAPLYNGDLHALEFRKNLYQSGNLAEYELGFYMRTLFQPETFARLQGHISRGVASSEEAFKALYRDLYFLRAHSTHCKVAVPMLLNRYAEIFPKKVTKTFSMARVSQALTFVWGDFFTETRPLMIYYWTNFCFQNKQSLPLERYLGIPETRPSVGAMAEEIQAMITAQQLGAENPEDDASEEAPGGGQAAQPYSSPGIAKGMEYILNKIDFPTMYEHFQSGRDLRTLFAIDDKLFYAYAILDYFDSEFTSLWAGNYINFYVLSESNGGRYDPKRELILLNGRVNLFYEHTNEYLRQYRSYKELVKAPAGGTQRLIQIENKEKDLARLSFAARKILIKLLEEYHSHLYRILSSKNNSDSPVGNWDEVIGVSSKVGRKLISDMTVADALDLASSLVEATEWLLTKSDLSGMGISLIAPEIIPVDGYRTVVTAGPQDGGK